MFVGREGELAKLEEQFSSTSRTAVLVYGKRRVGKSTLIAQAAKSFDGTVIEHLCAQSSFEGNLELLCRSVSRSLGLPAMRFDYLQDLFELLYANRCHLCASRMKQATAPFELFQYLINSPPVGVVLV